MAGSTYQYVLKLNDRMSGTLKRAGYQGGKTYNKLNKKQEQLNRRTRKYGGLVRSAFAGFGAYLGVRAISSAISLSKDFHKEMSTVKALTGATGEQFEKLEKQAMKLGSTTEFTAKQASEAMSFLAMAGFDTNKIIGAMPDTLNLAAAGGIELARAADISSNVLTMFNKETSELVDLNNQMIKTTTSANLDMEMLSQSMKYSGSTASALKVPFNEVSAAIGLMGDAGLQGSMAGTSLNTAMIGLANKSSKAYKGLKEVGIQAVDSAGNLKSLPKIIKQIEDSGLTASEIIEMFGRRGSRAILALKQRGGASFQKFSNDIIDSAGEAKRVAGEKLDNLGGDVVFFTSALQGFFINFQKDMQGTYRGIVQAGTKFLNFITKNIDFIKRWGKVLLWTIGIFKGIALVKTIIIGVTLLYHKVLGRLNARLQKTTKFLFGTGAASGVYTGLMGAATLMTRIFTGSVRALSRAIYSIPIIGWLAAGIALVVVLFKKLWDKSEKFRRILFGIGSVAKAIFKGIGQVVIGVYNTYIKPKIDAFKQGLKTIKVAIKLAVAFVKEKVKKISDFFSKIFNAITTKIKNVFAWFKKGFSKIFGWLGPVYNKVIKPVFEKIIGAWKWVKDKFKSIGKAIGGFFTKIWDGFLEGVKKVFEPFVKIWNKVFGKKKIKVAWESGKEKGSASWDKDQKDKKDEEDKIPGLNLPEVVTSQSILDPALEEETIQSARNISGGGKKATNINITLGSLVKELTIQTESTEQGIDELEGKVKEVLLRVLNSANSMAYG